jgi:thiol-disulfide isomerase/thioredoxin
MIKKLTLALVFLVSSAAASAQNREISFEHSDWSSILEKAKKENKLVYLDAYTSWCGPCKWMAKNVFTNDTVADFYNSNFVNAKIDMEKGEGVAIAKRYGIRAYPTMLFIDGSGNVIHRTCGSALAADFIQTGKDANNPATQLSGFTKKFKEGNADSEFAASYFTMLDNACQSFDEEFDGYFLSQKPENYTSKGSWSLIRQYARTPDSKAFQYLENHKADFSKVYTADSVDLKIDAVYSAKFYRVKEKKQLELLKENYKKAGSKNSERVLLAADVSYYKNTADWKKFGTAAITYLEKVQLTPVEINDIAWAFYEHVENKDLLSSVSTHAKKNAEATNSWAIKDTYASLLYKLGRKSEAKAAAEKAIESAKKEGEDYKSTQDLLDKINSLK